MLPITGKIFLLALIIITAYFFTQRAKYLISLLKLGKPEDRSDNPSERLRFTLAQVLTQRCALKNVTGKDLSGIGHMLLFYGFSLFVISYGFHLTEAFYEKLNPALFGAAFNNGFFFLLDLAGIVVMISIIWAAIRRYIIRPERLEPSLEAGVILLVVFSLMLLNFLVEGSRILAEGKNFAEGAFMGKVFSRAMLSLGFPSQSHGWFYFLWFFHMVVIFGFGIYILYSKHLHILASHPNIYFHSTRPKGTLQPIQDFESAESFGVSKLTDFSWKHLLDLYACTECGHCSANCPANNSGKPLKPKDVIINLKHSFMENGKRLLAKAEGEEEPVIVGSV
ncbi:MAG: (Fe-S)-binding protein, partial [Desulfobacterota bacterium]|nr:(Fe-S)-binding protein [Thermodesulfobacteriota bacterium]